MISLVATFIFFVLLFHAFYTSVPARPSHYPTTKYVVVSKFLLRKRGIDITRVDAAKLSSSASKIEGKAVQFLGKKAAVFTKSSLVVSAPSLLGMADAGQVSFQEAATPIMEGLIDLHHDIMFFLVFIVVFVLYLLLMLIVLFRASAANQVRSTSTVTHHT